MREKHGTPAPSQAGTVTPLSQGGNDRAGHRWLGLVLAFLLAAPLATKASSQAPEPLTERAARGLRVLQMQGCVACHSLDASPSAGPSFGGRWGTRVQVREGVGGPLREVTFDRDYLERSLEEPDRELAQGFAPGVMPAFALSAEQTDAVAAALQQLAAPRPEPKTPSWLLPALALATLVVAALVRLFRRLRRGTRRAP